MEKSIPGTYFLKSRSVKLYLCFDSQTRSDSYRCYVIEYAEVNYRSADISWSRTFLNGTSTSVLRILITLMRIRGSLLTWMRIRIQLFTLMRIRNWILVLIKVMQNLDHWSTVPLRIYFLSLYASILRVYGPSTLNFEPPQLLNIDPDQDPPYDLDADR
jgi:hypothetical protein